MKPSAKPQQQLELESMAKQQSTFARWMGPTLDALRQLGGSGKPNEVSEWIVKNLSPDEKGLGETLKSGQTRFYNQLHWARQYLVWEGLVDASKHGVWALTSTGYETSLTEGKAQQIAYKWSRVHAKSKKAKDKEAPDGEEAIDEEQGDSLLDLLKRVTPEGFERICARLLRESGFERVEVTGGSKDGGIDGIGVLEVNPFVTFKVLFQCKRYKGVVSRAQVGDFRNAMTGRAEKGIIMTTGRFTADARHEASRDGAAPIELVDGEKLVQMFERAGIGLVQRTVYEVDRTFFVDYLPKDV